MTHRAKASHAGGALSCVEILAALYGPDGRLRVDPRRPRWEDRDRFILSKGHACSALYAALAGAGFIDPQELEEFARPGSRLMAHASHQVPGVEMSTGSLGHGLPAACGMAFAARQRGAGWRTVVLLSDGELDAGSNWEALLFAAHHRLDRLWMVIDANGLQGLGGTAAVLGLEPLAGKLSAFGWQVAEIDGHDPESLRRVLDLDAPAAPGRPTAVIARTVKGKGVSFMEGDLAWHYRSPDDAQFARAMAELEA